MAPYPHPAGGGGRIRTYEGISQQIYSLPPLAAWVPLLKMSRVFCGAGHVVSMRSPGLFVLGRLATNAACFFALRTSFHALRTDFHALRATFQRGRGDPVRENLGRKSCV